MTIAKPHIRCLLALLASLLCAAAAMAQTDAQYSHYYEVPSVYNPAAIGLSDSLRLRGDARMQWLGIDNAPRAFAIAADMPFKLGTKRIAAGITSQTLSQGLFSSLQINAQGAYKVRRWGGELSIGVQVGMYDQKFRGSEVFIPDDDDYHQSTDDAIPMRDIHGMALDLAAGVWFRKPSYWVGAACTHITSPSISMKADNEEATSADQNYEFQAKRTIYLMAGCNIPIKNTLIELMPSVIARTDITFTTGEATLRARYNKMFIAGLGYRWRDAAYIAIGAELKQFYISYTYEYSLSAISKATSGSHEVMLGYTLKLDLSDKNKNKHRSIRIM